MSSRKVDLTTDNKTEANQKASCLHFPQKGMGKRKNQDRKSSKIKNIKWKTNEVLTFNPEIPAGSQTQNPFQKLPHQAPPAGNNLSTPTISILYNYNTFWPITNHFIHHECSS
jgi:hypothetical protein